MFPKKGENIPEIRFPEFSDAWKQRKVGDLLVERREMVTEDNEYPLMAFIANEGVAPKGDRFDRSALVKNADSKKYKRTKYGDFIYSSNNLESGSIGLNKYGKASISPVYSIFYPTNLADSDFIGRYFLRKDFIGQMIRWRQGVVYGQWKIPEADFLNIDIYIPSKDEQEKIGQILDKVDNTITLQQRKLNSLQKLKKGLLQKMFPKNGENIPEIRFPEFSDAWKQRKLSDIALIVGGGTPSTNNPEYWDGEIDWYAPAEINGQIYADYSARKITKLGLEKSSAKILPAGKTVLFTSRAGIGKTAILRRPAATNQGFQSLVLNDEIDTYFVYSMTEIIKQKAEKIASGSTFAEISGKMLGGLSFMFPKYTEQNKIGTFFSKLDNLITLQQRKLEFLQKLKKGLLQQMFI